MLDPFRIVEASLGSPSGRPDAEEISLSPDLETGGRIRFRADVMCEHGSLPGTGDR